MTTTHLNNWQAVQSEVLKRIHSRRWKPGDLIPNEADLAQEFGCARATVNRALQSLAESGLLDRRRRVGTRVATHPVRKATLAIPIIRVEIEQKEKEYSYSLIRSQQKRPPSGIRSRMRLSADAQALHIYALHLADGEPYAVEDRWINSAVVPKTGNVDFEIQNANEWLVMNAPFTSGDIAFSSICATKELAEIFETRLDQALFVLDRRTWNHDTSITSVRLIFAPGYSLQTTI